jgi:hypothetical protein
MELSFTADLVDVSPMAAVGGWRRGWRSLSSAITLSMDLWIHRIPLSSL